MDTDLDIIENEDINIEETGNTEVEETGNTEVEEKARRMGWVKEDNFKGDKDKWVSAEKFVERGETELPIMRERMKKLDGTVVGLRKTISSMKKTFGEFREYQNSVTEKAYEKALKDITRKQRIAIEDGDVESFDEMEEEKKNLVLEVQNEIGQVDDKKTEGEEEFDVWLADNEWFDKNKKLRNYAAKMSDIIADETGLMGTDLYNEVKKETQNRYPEAFGKTKKTRASAVESGGETPPSKKKQTFGNLPNSAKEACSRFIKQIPGFTKEEFLKNYEW